MDLHDGHRQRLKDRFRSEGLDHFEDRHVLELLLGYSIPRKDTAPLAKALLDQNLKPTREEVRDWFQKHRNICRCTGYENILRAVKKTMYRRLGKEIPQ